MRASFTASILALTLSACVGPRLMVRDTAADYSVLNLSKSVAPWEDGRRTPRDNRFYEWWYFDALLENGTTVVVWFGDNWFYGVEKRVVNIDLTPPGGPTRTVYKTWDEPGTFATDRADVRIGPHRFEGNLDRYTITVDPQVHDGVGCAFTLVRTAPSWRPGTGYVAAGDDFFAWLPSVPNGEVTGTLTIDGVTTEVRGSGYHDHNWGNVSPVDLMDSWWWGRANVGDRTFVISELRAKKRFGGGRIPLMYASAPEALLVDAWGEGVHFEEAAAVQHPDPKHARPIGAAVTAIAPNGFKATLPISTHLLTSADLLSAFAGWQRWVAGAAGLKPWYSRFESDASLTPPGEAPLTGRGTLEFFEFQ